MAKKPKRTLVKINVASPMLIHVLREGVWAACGAIIRHGEAVTDDYKKVTCLMCREKLPKES